MFSLEKVKSFFRGNVSIDEPLARFTTFKIGGPADYYLEPIDKEDLLYLVMYLKEIKYPYLIIGNGSNVLISDKGIRGAAINLEFGFNQINVKGNRVYAEAGIKLAKFVNVCIENSLVGVEMLAGIPGTLGGALVMNAGAYGGEISNYVIEVEVIKNTYLKKFTKEECGFAYRISKLSNSIILSANFEIPKGNKEKAAMKRNELIQKRNASQPVELPNAGSIFKNPKEGFAAKFIEEAGLKGYTVGGAKVSEKHSNFIINFHRASSDDVISLINTVKEIVYKKFNVALELEVRLLGFNEDQVEVN
jgi:UDP-N-acetylmuramate dehydrogenase